MKVTKNDCLPILSLFTRLREAGLPLGLSEYQLVLKAFQNGYGLQSYESLAHLCRTLWVKSPQEKLLFDHHFDLFVAQERLSLDEPDIPDSEGASGTAKSEEEVDGENKNKRRWRWRLIAVGGVITGVTGSIVALSIVTSSKRNCPEFISSPVTAAESGREYNYDNISVCKVDETEKIIFEGLKIPSGLEFTSNSDGTAALRGVLLEEASASVNLWNLDGDLLNHVPAQEQVFDIKLNASGDRILTIGTDPKAYQLRNLKTQQITSFTKDHQAGVWKIRYNSERDRFMLLGKDNTITLRDLKGAILLKLERQRVQQAEFSQDGKHIITVGLNNSVVIFDKQGQKVGGLPSLDTRLSFVQFDPESEKIITVDESNTAQLWSLQGDQIAVFEGHKQEIFDVDFCPRNQKCLLTKSKHGSVRLWDLKGNELSSLRLHQDSQLEFSPDGTSLVTSDIGGKVVFQDLKGNQILALEEAGGLIKSFRFTPKGDQLVTYGLRRAGNSFMGTAKLWDLQGNLITEFSQKITDRNGIRRGNFKNIALKYNKTGDHFLVHLDDDSSQDKDKWELRDVRGNLISDFSNYNTEIKNIIFSPNGNRLLVFGNDERASLWDLKGQSLTDFSAQGTANIKKHNFLPKGNGMLIYTKDNRVGLWDLEGSLVRVFNDSEHLNVDKKNTTENDSAATSLLVDTNSGLLYGYRKDGTVTVWSPKGELLSSFQVMERKIKSIQIFHDQDRLLLRGVDDVLEIRDIAGNVIAVLEGVDFEGDSYLKDDLLLVSQPLLTARLWDDKGNLMYDVLLQRNDLPWDDKGNLRSDALLQKNNRKSGGISGFSPNGNFFFTLGKNKQQVILWNSEIVQERPISILETSGSKIDNILFSPTNLQMLTWGDQETPKIWDVLTGKQLTVINTTWGQDYEAQFSPSGDTILTYGPREAILWNRQGKRITSLEGHLGEISDIEFSPDGKYLVSNSSDNIVRLWNFQGQLLRNIAGQQGYVQQAAFSHDSKSLITYGEDETIWRWDLNGKKIAPLNQEESWVKQGITNSEGSRLVTVNRDNEVTLWDLEGNRIKALMGAQEGEVQVEFSPDGNRLITWQSETDSLSFWTLAGEKIKSVKAYERFEFQPQADDFLLTYGGENEDGESVLNLFNLDGDLLNSIVGDRWMVARNHGGSGKSRLQITPDGESTISVEEGTGIVKRLNWQGKEQSVLGHHGQIYGGIDFIFNPSQNSVVITGDRLRHRFSELWSLDGRKLFDFGAQSFQSSFYFNAQGTHLLKVSPTGTELWNLSKGAVTPIEKWRSVRNAAFHPNGNLVILRHRNGTLRLWDLRTQRMVTLKQLEAIQGWHFSPQLDQIVTYSKSSIIVWDLEGNELNTLSEPPPEETYEIRSIDFSPDQSHLLLLYGDKYKDKKTSRLWDLRQDKIIDLEGHRETIFETQFTDSGGHLLTLDRNEILNTWDFQGQSVNSFQVDPSELDERWRKITFSKATKITSGPEASQILIQANGYDSAPSGLWDLKEKQLIPSFPKNSITLQALNEGIFTKSSNNTKLSNNTVNWWDWQGESLQSFEIEQGSVSKIQFNQSQQRILTLSQGRSVLLRATDVRGNTTTQRFTIEGKSSNATQEYLITLLIVWLAIFGLSVVAVFPFAYLILRWFLERKNSQKLESVETSSGSESTSPESSNTDQLVQEMTDEVQVAQAIRQGQPSNDSYLPLTQRQMKQNWRYLRRFIREGPAIELDIDATVKQIGSQGFLLNPILVPRRTNRTELLLLIDHEGSMVPFDLLTQRLAETAIKGGRLASTSLYYFRNCPKDYLYRDAYHHKAERISDVLPKLNPNYACILIFSDAGGARSSLNPVRYQQTQHFVQQLKQHIRYLAWLNPVPKHRWAGTTAAQIAQIVPMLECNRQGLQTAISVLQGKPVHYGAS